MKKICIMAAMAAAVVSMSAAPVSPDEALQRAIGDSPARIAGNGTTYTLARTVRGEMADGVYLFTRPEAGFILTPADDAAPALLGFGESAVFDRNGEMSPEFAYWMEQLARQVEYAASHPAASKQIKVARPDRQPIDILCATRWNQSTPFNEMCPPDDPPKSVTGCVATAMAQVMKYHNWPLTGEGKTIYFWNGKALRENFAEITYDWQNMLDIYMPGQYTAIEANAVAQLMKSAGYSVHMNYSPYGSGAQSLDIAGALGKYFRYDKSLRYLQRDYYSLTEWEELIYNSLSEYGPVIYDGQSTAGGHSFVCDGYQGDGYFHFNWGWGGLSDGYFLLDALDPMHQGIGGADGGFDYMQDAIVGIRPDTTGDSVWSLGQMCAQDICQLSLNAEDRILTLANGVYNFGPTAIENAYIGFKYKNIDDADAEPLYNLEEVGEIRVRYGFAGLESYVPELTDGRYEVTLAYKDGAEGVPTDVLFPIYGTARNILTVSGGVLSLDEQSVVCPDFTSPVFPEVIDRDQTIQVSGNLVNSNDSPYMCFLSAVLVDEGVTQLLAYTSPRVYDLEANETLPVDLEANFARIDAVPDGWYYISMAQIVLGTGRVTLLCEPEQVFLGDPSGVEEVLGEAEDGITEYYTVDGVKVAEVMPGEKPDLRAGIYVVSRNGRTAKIIIR